MPAGFTDLERERIAGEARHWVRIARVCNNRCAFCLDSDAQDGSLLDREVIEQELRRGREGGAARLILSGGEASIHPDFLDLVARGHALGYTHVQTITNGRMFAYPDFVRRAIDAGLDEVTFSLHGHTAELHEGLTGVPGSFAQTVRGIRNAVGSGRLIVSGDVVINRRNVSHLRRILDSFIALGVREIDLLMVVPFGRATPAGGEDLMVDSATALPHLRRALALAGDPGVTLWTNRLDPRLLEGFEVLIQDPHKLHDEVRGRRKLFDRVLDGERMRCAGDRCGHCFIRPLCDALGAAAGELADGVPGLLRVDARDGDLHSAARALLGQPRRRLWVRARDVSQLTALPRPGAAGELWLSLDDHRGLRPGLDAVGLPRPTRLLPPAGALDGALACAPPELQLTVDRGSAPHQPGLERPRSTRLWLCPVTEATLAATRDRDVDLAAALTGVPADGFVDVPPCLGDHTAVEYADPFPLAAVAADGRLDLHRFVDHFIRRRYRVKSLRCAGCVHDPVCRGIGLQRARAGGLGVLSPRER